MKKTIFFDLDGTLTDSGLGITKCVQLALDHFGIHVEDRDELRFFVGPPLRESFAGYGLDQMQIEEAVEVFRSRYVPIGKYENEPYPGIRELLTSLREEGHPMYVVTSKPVILAVDILEHFKLDDFFEEICGADLEGKRDNKEDVIAYLQKKVGKLNNVVMVGDTHYDVLGAAAHGIPTIGVTWGFGSEASLREAGAIAITHTMEELHACINSL
ncbi:MAG: HAD-IA family hydrolase [Ruminiclostridium sp.]|nr:HAD-IA family hydrolase [Ruminiclostridium sp.]